MTTATTIGKAVISDTREPGFEFINEQILKDIFTNDFILRQKALKTLL